MTINCAFINIKPVNRYVQILGRRLQLIYQGETTLTWSGEFGSSAVLVQFQEGSLFPWSAQVITNKVTEHSSGYVDVLQVEKWVEYQLTGIRQTIKKFTPQPQSPMSNIKNVPRLPTPMLFGKEGKRTNHAVPGTTTWSFHFGCIKATISYHPEKGWDADLGPLSGKNIYRLGSVEEVENWCERGIVEARNELMQIVPEKAPLELPKEEVPVLLGMKLEWEPDLMQYVLPGGLYGLRIQKANHGKYVGHLELNFEEAPLHEVVSKFDSLFKTIAKMESKS